MERNQIEVVMVPRALLAEVRHRPFAALVADKRLVHTKSKRKYPGTKGNPDEGIPADLYEVLNLGDPVAYLRPSDPGEFGHNERGAVACLYYQSWTED